MKVEIWACWILNAEWRSKSTVYRGEGLYGETARIIRSWATKDGLQLERIMRALNEFAGKELADLKPEPAKSPLKKQPGTVQEIDPEADEDRDLARKVQDIAKPADADAEMSKVLAWARSNPGKLLHGEVDYRPRKLGTIANPPSIFADVAL
jgi:hypothetical protein